MQCNIDARGRAVRRNGGIACLVLGAASLGGVALSDARRPFLIAGVSLIVAGLFQVYEAQKGWCALRAMGVKTPI